MIKRLLIYFLPKIVLNYCYYIKRLTTYYYFNFLYKNVAKRLRSKDKVNVAFFLFNADTWKADSVYRAFERNPKFFPIIVICPLINNGDSFLKEQLAKSKELVENNNYNFLLGFKGETKNNFEINNLPEFGIVFFLNPNELTLPRFSLWNNKNSLNCYIPYSFNIDNLIDYDYNNYVLNSMFRIFSLSEYHHNNYIKYSETKGKNSFVSGFPQLDRYLQLANKNPWKHKKKLRKKIIWGPHWTIPGLQNTGLDWSCFLEYSQIILRFADQYINEIEFAMKPHPFLFNLLRKDENWGQTKTDQYLNLWIEKENCQIYFGDYADLFIYSDALIHDSGSFVVEYLCLNKPVGYLINNNNFQSRFNYIGNEAIKCHEKIFNEHDLNVFLIDVLIGVDKLKEERKKFIDNSLLIDGNSGTKIVSHLEKIIYLS